MLRAFEFLGQFKRRFSRRNLPSFGILFFCYITLMNFNNCAKSPITYNENPTPLGAGIELNATNICSYTERDIFERGYHEFLKTECKGCHVNGPGKGTFASSDIDYAFYSFKAIGYAEISTRALSTTHSYATGTDKAKATIPSLKQQWQYYLAESTKCTTEGGGGTGGTTDPIVEKLFTPKFKSLKKTIPSINPKPVAGSASYTFDAVSMEFPLNADTLTALTDVLVPADTGGAKLLLTVSGYSNATGATGYIFSNPRLVTGTKSIILKGLHFALNGFTIYQEKTFQHVAVDQYLGGTELVSGGAMLSLGPIRKDDQLAVLIEDLEISSRSAPYGVPKVEFSKLSNDTFSYVMQSGDFGLDKPFNVTLIVDGYNSEPITVDLGPSATVDTGLMKTTALVAPDGRHVFDWDYRFAKEKQWLPSENTKTITFAPFEKSKTITLYFSPDQRYDVDINGNPRTKQLQLALSSPYGADLGTNSLLKINIPEYSPNPATVANPNPMTYSKLMRGLLKQNCVTCHNSLDLNGGYDITDYATMSDPDRAIIVPGDFNPLNHTMYRRMKNDAPGSTPATAMPKTGYLLQSDTDLVVQWILRGAPND